MTLVEQTLAQAVLLSGVQEERQMALLSLYCQSAVNALTLRLREGLAPEDCRADFVAAAARCLRNQAGLMMSPYFGENFSFRGV